MMITKFSDLDLSKQYSYADYLTWKFQERVELLKGWVKAMSPAPTRKHQGIAGKIYLKIGNFLEKKDCKIYIAPFDVRLVNTKKSTSENQIQTVVQPDICVICDKEKLDDQGCIGSPDLIIEIVSKDNTKKEMEIKYELYEENRVREYWIVSQGDETVLVFDLINNKYQLRKMYSNDSIVPVGIFTDFSINMVDVFAE